MPERKTEGKGSHKTLKENRHVDEKSGAGRHSAGIYTSHPHHYGDRSSESQHLLEAQCPAELLGGGRMSRQKAGRSLKESPSRKGDPWSASWRCAVGGQTQDWREGGLGPREGTLLGSAHSPLEMMVGARRMS